MIYGTSHASAYPIIINRNLTALASGFTLSSFFTFYPSDVLRRKRCLAGDKFRCMASKRDQAKMDARLKALGYRLCYLNIGISGHTFDCPARRRITSDLSNSLFYSWRGNRYTDVKDPMLEKLLTTHWSWVNGAPCYDKCCVA